jgi:hypothetical protein
MIYIFGQGTSLGIVFDESTLTEQDKKGGIPFTELPPKEDKPGYMSVLNLKEDKTIEWVYVKIKEELNEEINT